MHIDFGFILGKEPKNKTFPPPIKISKEMILAMGGYEDQNYLIFKTKCIEAFLYLRKYWKRFVNVFLLMQD